MRTFHDSSPGTELTHLCVLCCFSLTINASLEWVAQVPRFRSSENNDQELGASLSTPSRHGLFHSRTRIITLTLMTKGRIWELRTFILFLQRSPRAGPKCLGISNISKENQIRPRGFSMLSGISRHPLRHIVAGRLFLRLRCRRMGP